MTSLFNLLPNNILTLMGRSYRLMGEPVKGGSSLVYKARLVNDISADFYMIKEFFPYGMDIRRERNGSLYFPPGSEDEVRKRKERAWRESKIANKLRHGHNSTNNNPWFLSYSSPVEAHNTLYTVIATESGDMLSERIDSGFFNDKGFDAICDCALRILDALEPLHDKGYLHLDISPDNIHFSDTRIARLIDFNSAYRVGKPSEQLHFSYKEGYSARELIMGLTAPSITPAADLFSVAAILFEMLIGRRPGEDDWSLPGLWHMGSESGYLQGASELLISKTNAFLRKGLSPLAKRRFQSVDEMRLHVEELKRLKAEITLVNSPVRPAPQFVCRQDEVQKIYALLERDNYLFLEGMGGMGKTELAKAYAWDAYSHTRKYGIVQLVHFNNSLRETIAYALQFHNFDAVKTAEYQARFGDEAAMYICKDKVNCLKKHGADGQKVLLIIDNYQACEGHSDFKDFVSGNYHIIFTSRERHGGMEIAPMGRDDLFTLFCEYYAPMRPDNEAVVREIINYVQGHTMTIMLIAAAMRKNIIHSDEMLAKLQSGLDSELRTRFTVDKEGLAQREQVMAQHIRTLFDVTHIRENKNYAFIMANMALAPESGMPKKEFYDMALRGQYQKEGYDEGYTALDWLIDRRWVQEEYRGNTPFISLHAVISDVVYRELKPNSEMCGGFIKALTGLASNSRKTHAETVGASNMITLACKRLDDKTEVTAVLWFWYARLVSFLARYAESLKFCKQAAEVYAQLYGLNHSSVFDTYNNIAGIYRDMGDYPQAMEWYEKLLPVYEGKTETEDTATLYANIAGVYRFQEEYHKALDWGFRALTIRRRLLGDEHADTAMSINNIASVFMHIGDNPRALEWFHRALEALLYLPETDPLLIATVYNNIAMAHCNEDEFAAALDWNLKALTIRERILGIEHPETAISHNNIALVYAYMGNRALSLEWFNKALAIDEKVLGKGHPSTVLTRKNIEGLLSL